MAQLLLLSRRPEAALAALCIGQLRRLHGLRGNYGQCHEPGKASICLMAHVCIMAHVCLTANRQNQLLLLSRRPEAALASLRIGKLRRLHGLRENYGQCHEPGKASICLMAQLLLLSRRPEAALAALCIGQLRRLHGLRGNYGQCHEPGKASICLMAHVCIMAHVCLTANRQNQLLLLSRRPEAALASLRIGKLRRLHGLRENYGQGNKLGKSFARL